MPQISPQGLSFSLSSAPRGILTKSLSSWPCLPAFSQYRCVTLGETFSDSVHSSRWGGARMLVGGSS